MDITAIEETGNEVAHSVLLSDSAEHGICPNFLRIYDVFLSHEQPSRDRWGNKTLRKPVELLANSSHEAETDHGDILTSQSRKNDRLFQFIRMEFCDGGDLEDFIGLQKNKTLPLKSVAVPFFFQMVFGLYCAREKFNLRHCDIKVCYDVLLNFFLRDIGRANLSKAPGSDVILHYLLGDICFVLRMPASFSYWVKLADYGAADSNPENLGKPVTIDQFATLENSPIEFLLEGDAAEQSYAADTFSLGLCLLHLFTGSVARGDDENTLCHTLYRFVVLFGLPERNPNESKGIDKVWQLLLKHLRPEDPALNHPQRRSRRTAGTNGAQHTQTTTKDQFLLDQSLYSLENGSNVIIRRCREGLKTIPGAFELLKMLVDFDPSKRPTLKQVMYHPVFSSLRSSTNETEAPADYVVSYYKNRSQGARLVPDV
ncbi:unnamed protein product [Phytophthora lilii]|uniref:Unnamed protein product n=1 Tax=Phytophthora lilii TaxID=2077276 RepID=A0A9W6WP75_9STRA|nr:unnamed protein product [Phytophthora lilii]